MDGIFYQTLARSRLFAELRRAFSDATNLSLELAPACGSWRKSLLGATGRQLPRE
jgi:hypothetical protein